MGYRTLRTVFGIAKKHPELEAVSQNLSMTTLRYIPFNNKEGNDYLNEESLNELPTCGELFLSNAIVNEIYSLRA